MRVGIIGDVHLPFAHPNYLRFCRDVFESWMVNCIVFIGDVVDAHALSFWDTDPNGHSAEDEAVKASEELKHWVEAFPSAKVCIGNHDERSFRKARKSGIPDRYIRSYEEVYESPGWSWDTAHFIDGVMYTHGTGMGGKDAAINYAIAKRQSIVIGHTHAWGGVKFHCNEMSRIFGMNVGCGIDCNAYAFAYGKHLPHRPTLGCGIVLDGVNAYFEPMPINEGEEYHRSNTIGY